MRKCPLCDKDANSNHHIKPISEGGIDESRNIVWLCRPCHDKVEGIPFTPDLIETERRKNKERSSPDETYVFLVHDDCIIFAGVRINNKLIPFNIILPKSAFNQCLNTNEISEDASQHVKTT